MKVEAKMSFILELTAEEAQMLYGACNRLVFPGSTLVGTRDEEFLTELSKRLSADLHRK